MNVPQLRFKGFHDEWQKEQYRNIVNYCSNGFVGTVVNYYVSSNDKDAVRYIVGANVKPNKFDLNIQVNYVNKDFQLKYPKAQIHTNDMLMVQSGDIGTCCVVNEDLNNDYCHALIINRFKEHINPYFIAEYLNSNRGKQKLSLLFTGSTIKHINVKDLLHFIIRVPNFNEQSKVGQFFNKLDDLITKQMQKVTLLKQLKRGYLQKLFPQAGQTTPQLRFKGFNDEWQTIKLNDIYQKSKEKNTKLNFNQKQVISVANMHFNSDTDAINSTDDYMKTYNVMHRGDIAFEGNKSKKFFGGRFVLNDIGDGIVSHVFEVFSPIVRYDITFMKHYIHNERVMHNILLHSTTKTLMMNTLNSKEFLQQTILLPTLPEQQRIGTLFAKLDHLIELQNHKLELLQELKKGYLQKMFI